MGIYSTKRQQTFSPTKIRVALKKKKLRVSPLKIITKCLEHWFSEQQQFALLLKQRTKDNEALTSRGGPLQMQHMHELQHKTHSYDQTISSNKMRSSSTES